MLFVTDQRQLAKLGLRAFKEVMMNKAKYERLRNAWNQTVDELQAFCEDLTALRLRTLTDLGLFSKWRTFQAYVKSFWEYGMVPETAAYGGAPYLHHLLKKHGLSETEAQRACSVLSAPDQLSFYQIEERNLFKLYRIHSNKLFTKALDKHQRQYFWIGNSYGRAFVHPVSYFRRRYVKHMPNWKKQVKLLDQHIQRVRLEKNKLIKKYYLTNKIIETGKDLSLAISWQDVRKKYIFQYLHYHELFLREYSRRFHVPIQLLYQAWDTDLNTRPTIGLIKRLTDRSLRPYVVIFNKNRCLIAGKRLSEKLRRNYWQSVPSKSGIQKFSGIIAHFGRQKIAGKVFVIRGYSDLEKFPTGSILIASMTAPEYISAIRRAKAVITDEGGVTSHAAIVSRELNIPCIVGTKIATQVLRTGDRVLINPQAATIEKL